jgi:hypothetical protein
MTGMRKARLRWGKWVGGENLVYEDWDPSVHVISQGDFKKYVKASWKRDLTVDFGFTNAFCALWSAEDPEGRLYFYRELYGTQRKTRDWAHEICQVGGPDNERLRWVITDHDRSRAAGAGAAHAAHRRRVPGRGREQGGPGLGRAGRHHHAGHQEPTSRT